MSTATTFECGGVTYSLPKKRGVHAKPATTNVSLSYPLLEAQCNIGAKTVRVQILQGRNLKPLDRHGFGSPTSDPYVKLFFQEGLSLTDVSKRTLNPIFVSRPMELGLIEPDDTSVLEVQYWDYDKITNDDFGGAALVSIAGLLAFLKGNSGQVWLPLSPSDDQVRKGKTVTGDLLLGIHAD